MLLENNYKLRAHLQIILTKVFLHAVKLCSIPVAPVVKKRYESVES
jgi:hypothetical protein